MKEMKAILFDLDGVLINSEPLNKKVWIKTANHFGVNPTNNELSKLLGRRKSECVEELINWNSKPINTKQVIEIYNMFHRKLLLNVPAIPYAQDLVEWCFKNKLTTALVTSSTKESATFKTNHHKWTNLINIKVFGDDPLLKRGKPFPDPYLLAAERLNIDPQLCWAIEDSEAGCISAVTAGCKVWLLQQKKLNQLDEKQTFNSCNPLIIHKLNTVMDELKILVKSS